MLKQKLEAIAAKAGLITPHHPVGGLCSSSYIVVNRLAIEELEAWYFGDWEAVCTAYPRASRTVSTKARFREPDSIRGGTHEALLRVLQQAGYFTSGLRKIEAARAIAEHMVPSRNTSPSFCALRDALKDLEH